LVWWWGLNKMRTYGRTVWLLGLTLASAPLYVLRFRLAPIPLVGEYPTTLLEILIFLTAASWLWEKITTGGGTSLVTALRRVVRREWPVTLFVLAGLLSVGVSPDKRGAWGIFKAYIAEPVLIYFIIKDVVRTKETLFLLLHSLFFSGLWLSILAISQGLFGWFVVTGHEMAEGRAHGVYNTANALGLYLGPLVVLAVGLLRGGHQDKRRCGWLVGALLLAIFLSQSVGAVVGLAAGLLFLFLADRFFSVGGGGGEGILGAGRPTRPVGKIWAKIPLLPYLLAFFCLFFIFLAVPRLAPPGTSPPIRVSENTAVIRLCLWEGTQDLLRGRPLLGAGLSGFKEAYKGFRTCDDELLEYPHNIFLNFWAEMGLFGLVVFLMLTVRWLKTVLRLGGYRALGFGAALIYILAHGLVDVPYFKNDLALEFWALLALLERLTVVP